MATKMALGTTDMSGVYLGDTEIKKAYLGTNKVYEKATVHIPMFIGFNVEETGTNISLYEWYSYDGNTWTYEDSGIKVNVASYAYFQYKTVYDGTKYLLIVLNNERSGGFSYTYTQTIYTSTNGLTWSLQDTQAIGSNLSFYNLLYVNNKYVMLTSDGVYYSSNGINWTKSSGTVSGTQLSYQNNLFIVASAGSGNPVYTSSDGETWTQNAERRTRSPIAYDGTNYLACWRSSETTTSGTLWASADLSTWTQVGSPGAANYVDYDGSTYVVFGYNRCIKYGTAYNTWAYMSGVSGAMDLNWKNIVKVDNNTYYLFDEGDNIVKITNRNTATQLNIECKADTAHGGVIYG